LQQDLTQEVAQSAGLSEKDLQDWDLTSSLRAQMGSALSRLKGSSDCAVALFPLLDAVPALGRQQEVAPRSGPDAAGLLAAVGCLRNAVDCWGLWGCHSWPPLIDGKQVRSMHPHSQCKVSSKPQFCEHDTLA
jgi:hypothetical protein